MRPHELLDALQAIENDLGRKRIIDKGPRNIDLDIILYDDQQIADERLIIPHKLMLEREFVLRPLADLIPREGLPPPHETKSIASHLAALDKKAGDGRALPVTQLASNLPPLKATDPERQTMVMAVLNITPDSFSDSKIHLARDEAELKSTVQGFVQSGASIIDVGGQSTRPNAKRLFPMEEAARILPVIKVIRNIPEASKVAISVDTFYAEVAKAAIEAGADIVNDVSAGTLDAGMLPTVAKLRRSIIMMHMRGDPSTMNSLTSYPQGIIQNVCEELLDRVRAAEAAGIPRWRIILDPGIGFAKTQEQNLELLRNFDRLRHFPGLQGIPWVVGTSRKGFIGKITGVQKANQRVWGTAAAVTASIQGGADIVRVHDVPEMQSVVKMADAIFRVKPHTTSQSSTIESSASLLLGAGIDAGQGGGTSETECEKTVTSPSTAPESQNESPAS
jgi:2-amino-4-hydroxy-6-hydroxymethyldihydropteridine diphosphokinase / dihydropteroate synthase